MTGEAAAWSPTLTGLVEGPWLVESARRLQKKRKARRPRGFAWLDHDPHAFAERARSLLCDGRWLHLPPHTMSILKTLGMARRIAVFPPEEQALHGALASYLGLWLEGILTPAAWAFRPGRSAGAARQTAARSIRGGAMFVADIDIRDCFDTVPRHRLLDHLADLGVVDPELRRLIQRATGGWMGPARGLHQGSPLSPVLCNAWLHRIDVQMDGRSGYLRYADDIVCLEREVGGATAAYEAIVAAVREGGQRVHSTKSGISPVADWIWLGARWTGESWERRPSSPRPPWQRRRRA